MKKEEIIREVGNPILAPIAYIQLLCLFSAISSIFIYIWGNKTVADKVLLSSGVGIVIAAIFYHLVKHIIGNIVDEQMQKRDKNTFIERLEQLKREKSDATNN